MAIKKLNYGEIKDIIERITGDVRAALSYKNGTRRKKELEQQLSFYVSIKRRIDELQHFHDTRVGLWCIDRDPKEVDIEWIRQNAFQLESIDK